MRKIACTLTIFFIAGFSFMLHAQEQPEMPGGSKMDSIIARFKSFQENESKEDSLMGKPLGRWQEADIKRRFDFYDSAGKVIAGLDRQTLSYDEQINAELLTYIANDEISSYKYKAYLNPILSDEGFHTSLAYMSADVFKDKTAANFYLAKLNDAPRYIQENIALMRKGLALGISQPMSILNGYDNTYKGHLVTDPAKSEFYKPFQQKPADATEAEWVQLQQKAKEVIMQKVVPSYKELSDFFDKAYYPKTRKSIGVSNFPDGLAYYQNRVEHYTTTKATYDEVYQTGLREVARIDSAMKAVMKQVQFKGDLKAFFTFLRTDPKFYAPTGEQLLKEAAYIAKRADAALPSMFGKLPRQPYGVEAVPDYLAPTYTTGRYAGASIKGKRSAYYWVNTYELKSRPLYVLEALTLHEAVPGHHLQAALSQELEELPEFRRNLYVNAFGEGWGLYAEYLGTEMGFYIDPYTHFGRLTYEMWRACRLVIDVGLHAKGWTREQAVAYLSGHSPLSLHEVNTEVNRYISWPGQALAYKTGELKIRELRKKAETALGSKFDIRTFHDLVLSQGTVTLSILEKMVERFIIEESSKP
jgi:uncharacterized protein (DUF885 family)